MDRSFSKQEKDEDDMGLDWLFSSEVHAVEEEEEEVTFKCIHDREGFAELDDFTARNRMEDPEEEEVTYKCIHDGEEFAELDVFTARNILEDPEEEVTYKCIHDCKEFAVTYKCIHDGEEFAELDVFTARNILEDPEEEVTYKCIHDCKEFAELDDFSAHNRMEDPEEEEVTYKCIYDREEFSELDDFTAHNREFHKRFKKRCKICQNMFRDGKKLKRHVIKLHQYEEFSCLHDGRSFTKVNGLHSHNSNCHKKFTKVCPHSKCSNVFSGDPILQMHLVQQHPMGRPVHKKPSKSKHPHH